MFTQRIRLLGNSTTVFVFLSMLASAFNYFVYPLMSRLLPSSEYVDITVALSLLTQIGTFMSAILAINIGLSKERESADNKRLFISDQLNAKISLIFLIVAGSFLSLSPLIMPLVHTPIPYALPLSMIMLVSVPIAIISGHLNGMRRMVQLGLVTILSAGCQFTFAVFLALITRSGLIVLVGMALSQIIALFLAYLFLHKEALPSLRTLIPTRKTNPTVAAILRYAVIASFAIMALNLLQVVDLVFIKEKYPESAHFYANIYVLSRVVFFGGTIFIWPFLGQIVLQRSSKNIRALIKLLLIFTVISLGMILGTALGGVRIFRIVFGGTYQQGDLIILTILSVIFKLSLLIITAVSLYFIVIRNWTIMAITVSACMLIGLPVLLNIGSSPIESLSLLSAGSLVASLLALVLFYRRNHADSQSKNPT